MAEISQLPECLLKFITATMMTVLATCRMFAVVPRSNKARTSRYLCMLSIRC